MRMVKKQSGCKTYSDGNLYIVCMLYIVIIWGINTKMIQARTDLINITAAAREYLSYYPECIDDQYISVI
jgi:hypothetical protein